MASFPYPGTGAPNPTTTGGGSGGNSYLIPLIVAAIGAGASYLKNRAAGKSAQEQQTLYNQWLVNRANGVNDLIERVSAGGYNPFGPQVTTGTATDFSTKLRNSVTDETKTPFITPDFQPLVGLFKGIAESRLNRPSALPPGYIERSVAGINQSYAGADAAARNAASRKGLSGAQTFGLAAPIESSRAGKIGDFLATVPLKERELQNEDVGLAAQLAQVFGLGSNTLTKVSEKTTDAGSASKTLTSPPNLGGLASLILPPGPFAGTQSGTSTLGQTGLDLASILAMLWSSGAFGGPQRRT